MLYYGTHSFIYDGIMAAHLLDVLPLFAAIWPCRLECMVAASTMVPYTRTHHHDVLYHGPHSILMAGLDSVCWRPSITTPD